MKYKEVCQQKKHTHISYILLIVQKYENASFVFLDGG